MPWRREGTCCQCGECCRGTPPWALRDDLAANDPMRRPPTVLGMCPLYEIHAGAPEGEGFCIGHEPPDQHEYYLSGCNEWPTSPDNIADCPSCTYKFEQVADGG